MIIQKLRFKINPHKHLIWIGLGMVAILLGLGLYFDVANLPRPLCDSLNQQIGLHYYLGSGGSGLCKLDNASFPEPDINPHLTIRMPNGKNISIVKIAQDEVSRTQGLSDREQMSDNEGMWFVFDQLGIHPFWMKDMKFSLDIIWLDENYRITDITQNVPIPLNSNSLLTYQNTQPAKYALEVNAGMSTGLTAGDQLVLRSDI